MRRLGLHGAHRCRLAGAGPFLGSFRVLLGVGLGGEEGEGAGYGRYGRYGTGVAGRL